LWDWPAQERGPRVLRRMSEESRATLRAGFKAGIPFAVAAFVLALSYGVLAEPVIGAAATMAMSVFVFAGSAQFASTAVLAAGGGVAAATVAGILLNLRYVPMGIALAPSLRGGPLRRGAIGQAMIDASWAMASRGGGRFDPVFMIGATLPAYPAWVAGTLVGIFAGEAIGNPDDLGLDALFPAFFLALLVEGELRSGRRAIAAALIGGAIGLALTPIAPVGIPVIAASAAALIGLLPAGEDDREADDPEIEGDPVG
jgi:predicted branched-subunit amino acid permease